MPPPLDVTALRSQFPALGREVAGRPAVFLDGPAGSQVPRRVIDTMGQYLETSNANCGGVFATSRASDDCLSEAEAAVADLLGSSDPGLTVFGPNMTTLTLSLGRALARTWQPGDEVVVTRLDHDANFTPWVLAARDAGATVRYVEIRPEDCTLDLRDLQRKISSRTRLLAVTGASNAVGTVQPIEEICAIAHDAGAQVFLDAVHYAPHRTMAVESWGCDFAVCSAYKFFGPHVGILWGRRQLLEELPVYKVRPGPESLPGRWMTGTQNHEGIAGVAAAIDYLAELGRAVRPEARSRREALVSAHAAIESHERSLARRFLRGAGELEDVRVYGITAEERLAERVPTFGFTHARRSPREVAEALASEGIFVWSGNFYALPLTEALALEPDGMVRAGFLHYNTAEEVDRLLAALRAVT